VRLGVSARQQGGEGAEVGAGDEFAEERVDHGGNVPTAGGVPFRPPLSATGARRGPCRGPGARLRPGSRCGARHRCARSRARCRARAEPRAAAAASWGAA
jgi:hypothetical protein